jgi:hypothetical protein
MSFDRMKSWQEEVTHMKIILNQKMREKGRLQAMQVTLVVCLMNATLATGTNIIGSDIRDMTTG